MLTMDALRRFGANTEEGLGRCLNDEGFYLELVNMVLGDAGFDKLAAAGATVIPVEDKGPWVEACQPTIKANTEKLADVYQQLLDMAG